jgi:hypothetical protein
MDSYNATIKEIHALSPGERRSMVELYLSHYDATSENIFREDLATKSLALLVHHVNRLVGFTTIQMYERAWQGRPIRVVFSGDTVIDRQHWGQQALAFAWIAHMGDLKRRFPYMPLYWFLIVKGHRTYRYLPAFSKSFHPHWSITREDLRELADHLAIEKFGADYNPQAGVVELAISRGQLKPEIAYPGHGELRHAAVRYFLERNPHYRSGHELVCLCELAEDNLKPLARRIFNQGSVCRIRGCA